jgi:hypothetical protein
VADNVAITAGAGTTIVTDETASGHIQVVKLADGAADSTARIGGDATNGLDVDVTRVPADPFGANADAASASGSISAKLREIAANGVTAKQGTAGNLNCTEASASAIKTSVELIDDAIVADDAAFTPGTTKVLMAGFEVDDTSSDLADEGDAVAGRATLDRKLIVMLGESGANQVKGGGSKTDTSDQSIMAAGGAGVYNYLCWVTLCNTSSSNTYANIKDGSTVVAVVPLPAYGGAIFQPAHPIRGTANTAWNVASGNSVTTAHLYGGGFKSLA